EAAGGGVAGRARPVRHGPPHPPRMAPGRGGWNPPGPADGRGGPRLRGGDRRLARGEPAPVVLHVLERAGGVLARQLVGARGIALHRVEVEPAVVAEYVEL